MKLRIKIVSVTIFVIGSSFLSFSQSTINPFQEIRLDPVKVQQFEKYVSFKHSYGQTFESWKNANTMLYVNEMWYYSESFYVKRDHSTTGIVLNESGFDVSRFESKRSQTEEVVLTFAGSKDAIVLIPGNKLIYKP